MKTACSNISSMRMRIKRGHRTRDQDQGGKEAKRQRRNRAGKWVVSKGNDLIDNRGSGSRRGIREDSK